MDKHTKVTLFWNRAAKFIPFFNQTLELVYFSDIKEVLLMLGVDEYDPKWLDNEGKCFAYLCNSFPDISIKKRKS